MLALLPTICCVLGILAGTALFMLVGRKRLRGAHEQAAAVIAEARQEATHIQEAGAEQARKEQRRLADQEREELEQEREELGEYETEIGAREEVLTAREADFAAWEEDVNAQGDALDLTKDGVRDLKTQQQHLRVKAQETLVERSGTTREEVLTQMVHDRIAHEELDEQMRLRASEEALAELAPTESRRIMTLVVDRYNGVGHIERSQSSVAIADGRVFDALADPSGEVRQAFAEELQCELMVDDDAGTVSARGEDPLAREIARRVLRQVANRAITSADRIRGLVRQVRGEVDREVMNSGRKTLRQLRCGKAHPDILNLVGRLKYRLSYSQNQLKHSMEVAYLAGLLAEELKVDVIKARRGGILHDIGKAMTHDHEGSHALLGAEEARRCGEDDVIVNAIASHHDDVPAESPVAMLVTAADALSGARPGARREAVTQYLDRIRDIQRIAGASPAVRRVDIMQAGREVRVVVAGEERGEIDASDRRSGEIILPDEALAPLASEIARGIEAEVTFPGQIRVTVIRESRAVSMAH